MPKLVGYEVSPGQLRTIDLIFLTIADDARRRGQPLPREQDLAMRTFLTRPRAPCPPVGDMQIAPIGIGGAMLLALGGFLAWRFFTSGPSDSLEMNGRR